MQTHIGHTATIPSAQQPVTQCERIRRLPAFPKGRRNLNPSARAVTVDGEHVLAVSLSGGRGEQAEMYIEADAWEWVKAKAGPCWVLNYDGKGASYVCSAAQQAARLAGQHAAKPKLNLARLIASRSRDIDGLAVTYRNHCRRDLRMSNLRIVPRGDVLRTYPDVPPPVVLEGHV